MLSKASFTFKLKSNVIFFSFVLDRVNFFRDKLQNRVYRTLSMCFYVYIQKYFQRLDDVTNALRNYKFKNFV